MVENPLGSASIRSPALPESPLSDWSIGLPAKEASTDRSSFETIIASPEMTNWEDYAAVIYHCYIKQKADLLPSSPRWKGS